jgi:hypothetical protein
VHPLVIIRWRDAYFDFDANEAERSRDDYIVTTVGHLIGQDALFVSLAAEVLPDGDGFRAVTHIPLVAIVEQRTLAGSGGPQV